MSARRTGTNITIALHLCHPYTPCQLTQSWVLVSQLVVPDFVIDAQLYCNKRLL